MTSNIRPDEIPEGFTAADPTQASSAAGPAPQQVQKQAQEERKRSILEQSLTPEALARLGTLKVCEWKCISESMYVYHDHRNFSLIIELLLLFSFNILLCSW